MTKDENQTCDAYFNGIDNLGTCDTTCNYYNIDCPCSKKNKMNILNQKV